MDLSKLSYCPETGVFTWVKSGRVAGCTRKADGYVVIRLDNVLYYAHRLAWFILHGVIDVEVDHFDRNPSNNRADNLRLATSLHNKWNTKKPVTNKSGYKGVCWHKQAKCWRAYYKQDGRQVSLGLFHCKEEAYAAYCKAALSARGEWFTHG